MKARIFTIVAAKQAGEDLDVIDKGEDLDENDSGVEDASDMESDVEKCQIESLIKKYLNFAKFGDTLTEGDSSDEQSSKYEQEK